MKKSLLILIGAILILGTLFLLLRDNSYEITNINTEEGAIVAFGDSLVEGIGSTDGNDFVSLLSNRTGEEIINLGVAGDTTRKGLARLEDVTVANPKVVILLLGGNDAIQKVPIDETFRNLEQIIDRLHASGSAVLLVGIQGGIIGDKYKKPFKELAEEKKTAFVPDILDDVIGNIKLMADAIHPNNDGYAIVADRIEPVLMELLEKS